MSDTRKSESHPVFIPNKGKATLSSPSTPPIPFEPYRLCCVIEDEGLVFTVDTLAHGDVIDLKKDIQKGRDPGVLQGVDPHILELWKVCIMDECVM